MIREISTRFRIPGGPWVFFIIHPWCRSLWTGWDILWDETYENEIIMQDSVRGRVYGGLKEAGIFVQYHR